MKSIPISINNAREIQKLAEFSAFPVISVAFSPDNQHLAYGVSSRSTVTKSPDNIIGWDCSCVDIVDYLAGERVSRLPTTHSGSCKPSHLEYSSTGEYLAYVDSYDFCVWDIKNFDLILKQPIASFAEDVGLKFMTNENTEQLLVVYVNKVQTFDVDNWEVVNEFTFEHNEGYRVIAPKTNLFATLYKDGYESLERSVTVRNLQTGVSEWTHSVERAVGGNSRAVCFHPSGTLLAVGSNGRVTIWKVPQGEILSELRFERGFDTESLSFSPDGQLLGVGLIKGIITGGGEDIDVDFVHSFGLWDWEWRAQLFQLPNVRGFSRFSPDGSRLAIYNYDNLQVWTAPEPDVAKVNKADFNNTLPDYDNQGRPYGHPNYGDDW